MRLIRSVTDSIFAARLPIVCLVWSPVNAIIAAACDLSSVVVHLEFIICGLVGEALELVFALWPEAALSISRAWLQVRELRQEVLGVIGLVQLRQVWWRHRLVLDACPVDLIEPRVRFDLFGIGRSAAQTLVRVLMQQLHAQVTSVVRQEGVVDSGLAILNILVELFTVLRVKGWQTDEHFVNNGAKRPPVRSLAMTLTL